MAYQEEDWPPEHLSKIPIEHLGVRDQVLIVGDEALDVAEGIAKYYNKYEGQRVAVKHEPQRGGDWALIVVSYGLEVVVEVSEA